MAVTEPTLPDLPPLCAICDADVCAGAGWTLVDLASACMDGGARWLQVRAKRWTGRRLLEAVTAIAERARDAGATVVVNDRADIARLARAAGVHVGQEDLSPLAARALLGPAAVVGVSTHTMEQVDAALVAPVTYVAVGPVFSTTTKETGYQAVGLDGVRYAVARARGHGLPVVAIGGITLGNAGAVLGAGARSVAVISDLFASGNPTARVRQFLEIAVEKPGASRGGTMTDDGAGT